MEMGMGMERGDGTRRELAVTIDLLWGFGGDSGVDVGVVT